jgi:DNA processing protein
MNSELKGGFRRVTVGEDEYPKPLRELADRPEVLYIKGRWPLRENDLKIGIVGARLASPYGLEAATRLTADLVRKGVVTVSGLAAGIDASAHRATLKERGWTVAVLGHGFGHLFPKENASLFGEIIKDGTLVTEFPYDTPPQPRYFPQRNRIISGLSQGVLVVEAGEHSGALITARCAAEQGRDVFVLPGNIFSPQSRGCHRLIKEGARLVETAQDILGEYGFTDPSPGQVAVGDQYGLPLRPEGVGAPTTAGDDEKNLSKSEKVILKFLSLTPLSIDELLELSGMPVDRLAEGLLSFELKERILPLPGHRYVTRN